MPAQMPLGYTTQIGIGCGSRKLAILGSIFMNFLHGFISATIRELFPFTTMGLRRGLHWFPWPASFPELSLVKSR